MPLLAGNRVGVAGSELCCHEFGGVDQEGKEDNGTHDDEQYGASDIFHTAQPMARGSRRCGMFVRRLCVALLALFAAGAHAVPTVTSNTTSNSGATDTTSYDATNPATTVSGELLVSCLMQDTNSGTQTFGTPAAHTKLNESIATAARNVVCFSKDATGSDGATQTFTSGETGGWLANVLRITDEGGVDVHADAAPVFGDGVGETMDSPSVTTTNNNALVLVGICFNSTTATVTPPSGTTAVFDTNNPDSSAPMRCVVQSFEQVTAGATSAQSWSLSADAWVTPFTIAINNATATCASNDASPTPGTTITISSCPAFAGAVTTLTSPGGDTISCSASCTTTGGQFPIPAQTAFVSGQSMQDTEWNVSGTWTVGDGTTTENITLQVDQPAGANDFFVTIDDATNAEGYCSGTVAVGDEAHANFVSGTTPSFTSACSAAAVGDFEVNVTEWDESAAAGAGQWTGTTNTVVDVTAPSLTSPTGTSTGGTTADGSVSTDEGNGTLYWITDESCTAPSVAQIQAGQDNSGAAADASGNQAVSTTGVQNASATGLTSETAYCFHYQHQDAVGNDSTVSTSSSFTTDDVTAPVLTSPTGSKTGDTTADCGVSTDEADGTLYWIVDQSATPPSVVQIQAGQDSGGAAADASGNQVVSATGAQTANATGLSAGVTYYCHLQHADSDANDSTVVSSASFEDVVTNCPRVMRGPLRSPIRSPIQPMNCVLRN